MRLRRVAAALCACLALVPVSRAMEEPAAPGALSEMVAVVHLHTNLVDGASSPLEIARAARAAGIDALLFSDHFLQRVSYAPWPIGNLVGVTLSRPSVVTVGVERYLKELARVEAEVPGLTILPGTEVTPYARWTGSLLAGTLKLQGWHRHLLVVGLEDAADLRRLPALGNRPGGAYNGWSILFGLPALAVVWSVRRLLHPGHEEARVGGFRLRRRRRPWREIVVAVAALGMVIAGYPYRVEAFSPVGRDPDGAPFRRLIEQVRARGGVTVWAHPEASAEKEEIDGIRMVTEPYPDLVRTTNADGFGVLPEGARSLLPAGGIWDRALIESLAAGRHRGPFALAESDEHGPAGAIDFGALQTVFLVRERSRRGILEALREGRLYGRWTPAGQPPLRLADFRVEQQGRSALQGGSIVAEGPVMIHLTVGGGDGAAVTARLVRGGEVIWTDRRVPPFEARLEEPVSRPTYYRLDVEGRYPYRLVGNPVVVLPAKEGA